MQRKYFLIAGLILLSVAALTVYSNYTVSKEGEGKMFSDVNTIPAMRTGLLLGTGKYLQNGRVNPYYAYRIAAAIGLFRANKIRYLIISGDNSRRDYDEPDTMRQDLIAAGIDSSVLYCDYAGFRTFDSMVRAHKVFGQDSVTIISQPFHNERALFLAKKENMYALGFNAKDVGRQMGRYTRWRERFARVKVFVDYWIGVQPKYLGKQIVIPS